MSLIDGRGRWSRWPNKKRTTADNDQLDIAYVARLTDLTGWNFGSLTWTRHNLLGAQKSSISYATQGGQGVRLLYSIEDRQYDYVVSIVTTQPHYGGRRWWWICPQCRCRCRILYGRLKFLCRRCHNLTYKTTQASKTNNQPRISNRLFAIRGRLGDSKGIDSPLPAKPQAMHRQTYRRLVAEYRVLQEAYDNDWLVKLHGAFRPGAILDKDSYEVINDLGDHVAQRWKTLKADRKDKEPLDWWFAYQEAGKGTPITPEEWRRLRQNPNRLTLGELAATAGVSFAFAQEAQREGLITPDQGRTTRRKRYRARLGNWLGKLWALRQAGLSWEELRAWAKRRWQAGYEHERLWPEGFPRKTLTTAG